MLGKNPFEVWKLVKFEFKVQGAKYVKGKVSKFGQYSSPSVLMMQASNENTCNIKVVDIFKTINGVKD